MPHGDDLDHPLELAPEPLRRRVAGAHPDLDVVEARVVGDRDPDLLRPQAPAREHEEDAGERGGGVPGPDAKAVEEFHERAPLKGSKGRGSERRTRARDQASRMSAMPAPAGIMGKTSSSRPTATARSRGPSAASSRSSAPASCARSETRSPGIP